MFRIIFILRIKGILLSFLLVKKKEKNKKKKTSNRKFNKYILFL